MVPQHTLSPFAQRRSLALRLSLLFLLAATLPLLLVMLSSSLLARSTLLAQATTSLETDAQTHAQLINDYLSTRFLDVAALSTSSAAQGFLSPQTDATTRAGLRTEMLHAMDTDFTRDTNYANWSVWNPQGQLEFSSNPLSITSNPPWLTEDMRQQMKESGEGMISPVLLVDEEDTVALMVPVISNSSRFLGFLCATLQLNYVWNVVRGEREANGAGSYAFLLDQNGVRLADTDPHRLFTSIAPFSAQSRDTSAYGQTVPVLADATLASIQASANPPSTFEATPYGQHEPFQIVRYPLQQVPWTYFVLSPLSTVTLVANQQIVTSSLIACLVLVLAGLVGLWFGRRLARPIRSSVVHLRQNSHALHTLATNQQSVVNEQSWIVHASEMGLQEIQRQVHDIGLITRHMAEVLAVQATLVHRFDRNVAQQAVDHLKHDLRLLEQILRAQKTTNQNIAIALKVTRQVTDQLTSGALSATDAAEQLEEVVKQLREVVGERGSTAEVPRVR